MIGQSGTRKLQMIGQQGTIKWQMIGQSGTIVPQMIDYQMTNWSMINILSIFKFILFQYRIWCGLFLP